MHASGFAALAVPAFTATPLMTSQTDRPQPAQSRHEPMPDFAGLDQAHRGHLKRSGLPRGVEGLQQLRAPFAEAYRDSNDRLTPDAYAGHASIHTT
jgi:hypothetical protein